jgi:hypothetical protein
MGHNKTIKWFFLLLVLCTFIICAENLEQSENGDVETTEAMLLRIKFQKPRVPILLVPGIAGSILVSYLFIYCFS